MDNSIYVAKAEMSSRNISWGGKGGRRVGLTLLPSYADCLEIWEAQPPGPLWACTGIILPLHYQSTKFSLR